MKWSFYPEVVKLSDSIKLFRVVVISLCSHFVNLSFHHVVILSTCHFIM
jgi:hypothetical protein